MEANHYDQLFQKTFSILNNNLLDEKAHSPELFNVNDEVMDHHLLKSAKLKATLLRKIADNFCEHKYASMKSVEERHKLCKMTINHWIDCCKKFCLSIRNRTNVQSFRAEKRFKELVFEVLGEYAKSKLRISKRKTFIVDSNSKQKVLQVWKLRWDRFCLKFTSDLYCKLYGERERRSDVIRCKLVCPDASLAEFESVLLKLNKKVGLVSGDKFSVMSVLCISVHHKKSSGTELLSAAAEVSRSGVHLATCAHDLATFGDIVSGWLTSVLPIGTSSRKDSVHTRCKENGLAVRWSLLISSKCVEWMHPCSQWPHIWTQASDLVAHKEVARIPVGSEALAYHRYVTQHTSALWSERVYFCLEQVLNAAAPDTAEGEYIQAEMAFRELVNVMQLAYKTRATTVADMSQTLWRATELRGDHRESAKSTCSSLDIAQFPDVVLAVNSLTGSVAHLVAATVSSLAAVHRLMLSRSDPRGVTSDIPRLFCLAWNRTDPPGGAALDSVVVCVVPLTCAAVDSLSKLYISSPADKESASTTGFLTAVPGSSDAKETGDALNAFDLLPDRADVRTSPSAMAPSSKLHHTYFLMSDENVYCGGQDCEVSRGVTVKRPCLYFVQACHENFSDGNGQASLENDGWLRRVVQTHLCAHMNSSLVVDGSRDKEASLRAAIVGNTGSRRLAAMHSPRQNTEQPGRISDQTLSRSRGEWDADVLSALCRWRSCLCDSAASSSSASAQRSDELYLCALHSELKMLLDRKGGKNSFGSEAAKYLPRKAPSLLSLSASEPGASPHSGKKDVLVIRAASTLLQELWDGKLSHTIKSFTKKMGHNMNSRSFLAASVPLFIACHPEHPSIRAAVPGDSAAIGALLLETPSWARWKNADLLARISESQRAGMSALEAILQVEVAVSLELDDLQRLGVFPSAELVVVRREMRAFKESQDAFLAQQALIGEGVNPKSDGAGRSYDDLVSLLTSERKVSERKHVLLLTRRQEEVESRQAALARKVAKNKAADANQARDPANFRNYS